MSKIINDETYFTKIKKYYSYLNIFKKKNKLNTHNYNNNVQDIKRTLSCCLDKTNFNIDKNNKFSKSDTNLANQINLLK